MKKYRLTQIKKNDYSKRFDFLISNKLDIEKKIEMADNFMGINNIKTYLLYKIIFTITGILVVFRLGFNDWLTIFIYGMFFAVIGFLVPDMFLWYGRRKRRKTIQEQVPLFLITLDIFFKAGLTFEDILSVLPDLFYGAMYKEVLRLHTKYSMSKNFEDCIKEFCDRLDIPEKDEIELKLRQIFYSGVYEDILSHEHELIEKKIVNDMRKESEMYNLYIGLCYGLLIFNIFIIVVLPLMNVVAKNFANVFK